MIGEWNDLLGNDIMFLKRDHLEPMMAQGIHKFILIGENVLNFHSSDDEYYNEWFEEVNEADGWIALLNFRAHVLEDFQRANIDQYFLLGGQLNALQWRTTAPGQPDRVASETHTVVPKCLFTPSSRAAVFTGSPSAR